MKHAEYACAVMPYHDAWHAGCGQHCDGHVPEQHVYRTLKTKNELELLEPMTKAQAIRLVHGPYMQHCSQDE